MPRQITTKGLSAANRARNSGHFGRCKLVRAIAIFQSVDCGKTAASKTNGSGNGG